MSKTDTTPERKHLTRYSREKTSFDGWRVCISKRGYMFTKYISDREHGGEQASFEVARALRDEILTRLKVAPPHEVIPEFQQRFARKGRG